jgi:hypothetical protein
MPVSIQTTQRTAFNFPFLLMIGLPAFAILASVGAAIIAVLDGDPTLPDDYHWEGLKLDHDFARSKRAADLDVRAALQVMPELNVCRASLQIDAPPPPAITLSAIHGAHPEFDRHLMLIRRDPPGGGLVSNAGTWNGAGAVAKNAAHSQVASYEAPCEPYPVGQWHIEWSDPAGGWSLREDTSAALDGLRVVARSASR